MAGNDAVANAVSEIVEAAVEGEAEARVEAAVARAEAAEETAQALTDAAIMTRLGEQVGALQNEVTECKSQISSLRQVTEATQTKILEISAATVAPPTVVSLTQPTPSPEPSPPEERQEPINPAEAGSAAEVAQGVAKTDKPRRRLL